MAPNNIKTHLYELVPTPAMLWLARTGGQFPKRGVPWDYATINKTWPNFVGNSEFPIDGATPQNMHFNVLY